MHNLRKLYILLLILWVSTRLTAQTVSNNPQLLDTTTQNILSLREFYGQIMEFHPFVRQAKLLNEVARQEVRIAWGGFDPKLTADYQQKQFAGTEYYSLWSSKFKLPTWIGDVHAGYDRVVGTYINPENFIRPTDAIGQTNLGITIPLGRGFVIDERRNALRQAQIYRDIADAEKVKIINKVLLSAAKDYWEWYFAYRQYLWVSQGVELARLRFEGTKQRVRMGELAAMDSVQAKITYQNRLVSLRQADVELTNARIILSNYMWGGNDTPLEIREETVPESFGVDKRFVDEGTLRSMFEFAREQHPEIRKIVGKLKQLDVEQRFQVNNLLPTLDVNYNILRNIQGTDETTRFMLNNNYKWGFNFEFPLLLRKERGKLQQVRLKQVQNNFELMQTRREIQNAIQTSYNELKNLEQQIQLQQEMVKNYQILVDGEIKKFGAGESNLFLINTFETALIDSQVKLESQKAKYEKARAMLTWASGGQLWQ
ncbi:MAG: TolC family protein [Microscillaceae bacterium]|nr:TolC family protein [Microscillaceae bacterium]